MAMSYRPDIDGLRAVAVLPVVLYHAGVYGPSGGYVGVDVFFVISGFLITSIVAGEIAQGRFSLVNFYERRARRILPALVAVIVATFMASWFILLPKELQDLGASALAAALFVSNIYFALTLDYFARAAEFAPLLHTWSLAVEEQFYLFFPPLLMLLFAWRGRHAALWTVAILSLVSLAAAQAALPFKPDWVFYLILSRAWELGVGAALALAALSAPRSRIIREVLGALGLAAILLPVFLYDTSTPFPGLAAAPPVLGAALLIHVGAHGGGSAATTLLSHRGLVWFGLISYSLYLWHWPILALLRNALDTVVLPPSAGLAAVALAIALSWLSWRYVERPFRARSTTGRQRQRILGAATASLLAMALVGGILYVSAGMPHRLPPAAIAIAAAAQDRSPRHVECFGPFPEDGPCTIGASPAGDNRRDFLFWGDSHAEAFLPGVDRAAAQAGRTGLFAAQPACPPIREMRRIPELRPCTAFNESVWALIESRQDLPLIILAARWPLSVEGTRYSVEGGGTVRLQWAGPPHKHPPQSDNATIFEAGLRLTLARLRAMGRTVVLLGPVPEFDWDIPSVASRASFIGRQAPKLLDAKKAAARTARTEDILRRIADSEQDVRYIPLSDLFCDDRVCRSVGPDGLPYYRDDDHLTRQAAEDLLPPRLAEIW